MNNDDIINIKVMRPNRFGQNVLVSFRDAFARDNFVQAKHLAIQQRIKAGKQADLLRNKEPVKAAEFQATHDRLKNVRISEDLTLPRLWLLNVVKNSEYVKAAYTRNAVIHAVFPNGDKAKIYSALDLCKIGYSHIPFEQLGIPEYIALLHFGRTNTDQDMESDNPNAENDGTSANHKSYSQVAQEGVARAKSTLK